MNKTDLFRNAYGLSGRLARKGYMRWWHSFQGTNRETGETRTFFIEYFLMNPALGGDIPIWGLHPYYRKRHMRPSYFLIKAGVLPSADGKQGRQLHRYFGIHELSRTLQPFTLQAEECFCSEQRISGSVEVSVKEARHRFLQTDAGTMDWNLEVHKTISCHTGFIASPVFTALNALDSFWHGEGIQCYYRGQVALDGQVFHVTTEDCYGYADKHWGRAYNSPWLQFASCHLHSERTGKDLKHSALALDGCHSKFLCIPLRRKLNLQLTYTGEDFDFTFANILKFPRIAWDSGEKKGHLVWHIKARNHDMLLKLSISSRLRTMMPMNYETTDGRRYRQPILCGNQGLGWIEIYRRTPAGLQLLDKLTIRDGLCEYQDK